MNFSGNNLTGFTNFYNSIKSKFITTTNLTVNSSTVLNGTVAVNGDITQTNTNKIDQSESSGVNLLSDITLNNDSDINLYGTSSINQNGSFAENHFTKTNVTGILTQTGNINQISGTNILLDTAIGNIAQNNKSISQLGTTSNTLKTTSVTDLTVTNSLIIPSNVTIPGATYNANTNYTGSAIINQSGTGTNIFKTSDFTQPVTFDDNITMSNSSSQAYLKQTNVTALVTSGNIYQSAGSATLRSVAANDITVASNYDVTMSGDGVLLQSGTGTNVLKDTTIKNLTVTDSIIYPSGFTYPLPSFSIGTVTDLGSTIAPTVSLTGTNANPVLNFGLKQGIQGIQGPQGNTGSNGAKGDKGEKGDEGDSGPAGDSSVATGAAVAAGASAAVAAAAAVAAGVSATASATSAAASAASAASAALDLASIQPKVIYQTAGPVYTRFTSDLQVSNGVSTAINLNMNGTAAFSGNVTCEKDLTVQNNMRVNDNLTVDDNTVLNNLYVTNNISSQLRFGNNTHTYCASHIEYVDPISNPLNLDDLGTMNLRAANINIGNYALPATVNINGIVTFQYPLSVTSGNYISMW